MDPTLVLQAPEVSLFGPIDAFVAPFLEYILLVLVIVNMGARAAENAQHKRQAREGADAITRHPLRVATNFLVLVGAFYLATVEYHSGMVLSVLVLGVFISDLFEFESRKVEARRGLPIERPMGAIAGSVLVLLYTMFLTLFFIVEPLWTAIV